MSDPIKPTAAQVDAVLYQMATFQDGNAQPHTIALINEMADLLQAFAAHAQQAREQALEEAVQVAREYAAYHDKHDDGLSGFDKMALGASEVADEIRALRRIDALDSFRAALTAREKGGDA